MAELLWQWNTYGVRHRGRRFATRSVRRMRHANGKHCPRAPCPQRITVHRTRRGAAISRVDYNTTALCRLAGQRGEAGLTSRLDTRVMREMKRRR